MKKPLSQKKDGRSAATRKLRTPEERLILEWGEQIPQQDILRKSKVVFDIGLAQSDQHDREHDIFLTNRSFAVDSLGSRRCLDDTFHYAAGPALACGQCLGILPIEGILSPDHLNLRFTWVSWRIFCTLFMMTGACVMTYISFYRLFDTGITVYKFGISIFFSGSLTALILFLLLARKWSSIINTVAAAEMTSHFMPHVGHQWSLRKKFNLYCSIFLTTAAIEHGLRVTSDLTTVLTCSDQQTILKQNYTSVFEHIYNYLEFSPWNIILLQVWNIQATMLWYFEDLFIILVSYYLADRFQKLNDHLVTSKGKHSSKQFWDSARAQYGTLSQVVNKVDTGINKIIAVTCGTNLFIICQQMFNYLSTETNVQVVECNNKKIALFWPYFISSVFFCFSFGILILRFLLVSLAASSIHVASKKPKGLLHALSSQHYCSEVKRFLDQVTTDKVGLTGFHLFTVTRGLILKIAGTVLTYELVLLQLNSPSARLSTNVTIFTKDFNTNVTTTV